MVEILINILLGLIVVGLVGIVGIIILPFLIAGLALLMYFAIAIGYFAGIIIACIIITIKEIIGEVVNIFQWPFRRRKK